MVTFCTVCGTSLPLADILITRGKEITSPDYRCPECGDFAAEEAHHKKGDGGDFDLEEQSALVLHAGVEQAQPVAGVASRCAGPSHPPAPEVHHAVAAAEGGEEVVIPPDEDLFTAADPAHHPQPSLPAVPATDEEVQEDLPDEMSEEDDAGEFIERPE